MCGIAGFLSLSGGRCEPAVLERMLATLRHRGPDARGAHVDDRAALGAARLQVIDLETGDQPIANEDGTVHVVHNGEIYNNAALRAQLAGRGHRFATRSDTEVLVHAWEEYGQDCVDHLNGMFAFAIWDHRSATLLLARDRMGEKPLYYTAAGGWLIFASELRAVLAHPAVRRELDMRALSRYLAYDFVPDPHSMVCGVEKLSPGYTLTARGGRVTVRRYWDIRFDPDEAVDEAAWYEELRWRLDEAVRLRLESDVPLGCFLSGGIDSTAVTATVARSRAGLATFSVGFTEAAYDERRYARLAARQYATRHEELVVTANDAKGVIEGLGSLLDEPLADTSFVPLYLLSRAARETVTVALTGDGGDELFAGYRTMPVEWWHRHFARLPAAVRRALRVGARTLRIVPSGLREFLLAADYPPLVRNQALLGGLSTERHRPLLSPGARAALDGFEPYRDIDEKMSSFAGADSGAELIYYYCKFFLAGQNLANADRASMAASLELRAPLLDHTFVDFVGRIPTRYKFQGFRDLKGLFRRALADRLAPEILARRKHGFNVPMGSWMRGPLAATVREVLAAERIRAGAVFDASAVERLVEEHVAGERDHGQLLWSLLVFECWRARYLSNA